MVKQIDASPPPSNHIATLTRVGYSFNTAVGDLLDNSIAAGASKVHIFFGLHSGTPIFYISDDGDGMSNDELIENMRVGCKNPTEIRSNTDLGRFGAGLKTASFSQAEVLTVCSWKQGFLSGARWDLAIVRSQNAWTLEVLEEQDFNSLDYLRDIESSKNGTVVTWTSLTCIDTSQGHRPVDGQISELCTALEQFISLYFHRFLEKTLSVYINGRKLVPIDPFMRNIEGYQEGPRDETRTKAGRIIIQAHLLPRLASLTQSQIDLYGGSKNIVDRQGLYIYRNRRLILEGGWYGASYFAELSGLARIQIDIPASLDLEWGTDVKKSTLNIPSKIKRKLKRMVVSPREKSVSKNKYSGRLEIDSDFWYIRTINSGVTEVVSYEINPKNELLMSILSSLDDSKKRELKKYLLKLSSYIPINHIYLTKAEKPRGIVQPNPDDDFERFLESLDD